VSGLADRSSAAPARASALDKRLPGLAILRRYQRAWLMRDVVGGVVLTAVLIPVGMGYAEAAGVEPIYGLYATIGSLVVYALVGPSRNLVLGPDSSLAPIIAATILPLAAGDPAQTASLAAALAVLTGALCLMAGLVRAGFVTELLAVPIRYGYLNGIALTILVGQLPKLFGFSTSADGLVNEAAAFATGVRDGMTNPTALAIGVAALAFIVVVGRLVPRLPAILIAVVVATIVSAVAALHDTAGVPVVGALPPRLPLPSIPPFPFASIGPMLAGAVAIALVSMADTSVLSRTIAARSGERAHPNKELIALGAANLGSAVLSGFSVSASASRTSVAMSSGVRSQLAGLIGAGLIVVMLVVAPGLLASLPSSVLAAVVIAASLSLVEIRGVVRLYRLRRSEFVLSIACLLAVAFIGVVAGIFFSVGVAIAAFLWRAWRPYSAVLGRIEGVKGYHDISRHPDAERVPGLVLFRWDAPLFFANAEMFREGVEDAIAASPTPARWVVIAAEPVTDIDTTAADVLDGLHQTLEAAGIELAFAELKGPTKDRLRHYGLFDLIGHSRFYPTVGAAVSAYVEETGAPWVDWEDRGRG
jgi:high affinity sulfate transporter 1